MSFETEITKHRHFGGNNYDRIESDISNWGNPDPRIVAAIYDNVICGSTIINLAGGDGRYEPALLDAAGPNGHVVNIDLDDRGLIRMQNRLHSHADRLSAVQADLMHSIPVGNESVETVVSFGYAHLPAPDNIRTVFFPEIMRILKPNGKYVGNFLVDVVRRNLHTGDMLPVDRYAEQAYTLKDGMDLLKESFSDHLFTYNLVEGISVHIADSNPPMNWQGSSIVFSATKISS